MSPSELELEPASGRGDTCTAVLLTVAPGGSLSPPVAAELGLVLYVFPRPLHTHTPSPPDLFVPTSALFRDGARSRQQPAPAMPRACSCSERTQPGPEHSALSSPRQGGQKSLIKVEQPLGGGSIEIVKGRGQSLRQKVFTFLSNSKVPVVRYIPRFGNFWFEAVTGFSNGGVLLHTHREAGETDVGGRECSQDGALPGREETSRELSLQTETWEPRKPTSQAAFQSSALAFQNLLGKAPLPSCQLLFSTWHQRA